MEQRKKLPHLSGKGNFNWKGGRIIDKSGYVLIFTPHHPYCNSLGYIREHRLVMEKHIKRFLLPIEVVHHKGNKYPKGSKADRQDNRLKNLKLFKSHKIHAVLESYSRKRDKRGRFK